MAPELDKQPPTDTMVWIDMEMTGLDAERERVLEIAVIVTDAELNEVAVGPELVIHQSEEQLAGMDEWNQSHHGASGLIGRVRDSKVTEQQADAQIVEFLRLHCAPGSAPLAGNSVHQDRRFLRRYLPGIDAFLHYRIVDVSTVKELARRWYPSELASAPPKKELHRALEDIRESIAELQFYRERLFRAGG